MIPVPTQHIHKVHSPPPSFSFGNVPSRVDDSVRAPAEPFWRVYWTRLTWYVAQGGRVAVSVGIASWIWLLFAVLPGAVAWLLTLMTLVWVGQYDVHLIHTKRE
jgi:hypothetical protein